MTRTDDLERAAARATPAQLNVMLADDREAVRRAAVSEHERREEHRKKLRTLTGNVSPIEET
jgi:hypothetical protein